MRNTVFKSAMPLATLMAGVRMVVPFAPEAGWKLTADGKAIELKDGNPIWIDDKGNEATMSGDTITRLNGEAKNLRERAEGAETKLAVFKDIDPTKAKTALETMSKIDQKKLIDAGEVDKVKDAIKQEYTGQLTELQTNNQALQSRIDAMTIDGVFAQSEFIRERVAIPRDMFEASMRSNFSVKDGKLQIKDKAGNPIMSKKKIGEYADADEALELLVEAHPQKDTIIKANANAGSGNGGNGGNRGQGSTMKRAEFEKLAPADQGVVSGRVRKGELQIVD